VKPSFLFAAVAVLAATVHAAPATAPKPPSPPGPVAKAMSAMAQELSGATPVSLPPQQRLDALLQFRHTPATAALLEKIYGSTPAWTLSRLPAGPGAANYRGVLAPLHFRDNDGSTVDWAAFPVDFAVGGDGRSVDVTGSWPQMAGSDKDVRVTLSGLKLALQQQRSADLLWFGGGTVDIDSVTFEPQARGTTTSGPRIAFEGIRINYAMRDQQSRGEMVYQFDVRRLGVGAEGVDNIKIATRLTSIDRQSLLELQKYGASTAAIGGTPEQKMAQMRPLFRSLARGAIRSGTALEIDEISASFHGQSVRASGRVSLEGALEADLDNASALLKKLALRLSVKAPLALLREVSTAMAEMQVRAKNNGQADPQAVAQLAGTMNDLVLGKMISSGFVRLDGDMLSSEIAYNAALGLRINGKATPLPAMPGTGSVAAASPQMMQARRIDERCVLPAYPDDVVKADAPLALSMRLLVKADGSVRNVTLASPSNRPDYDQAALAAAARCVCIPALRNGQPVDVPMLWKVVREAGSTRP
jgi:TonB family protein